MITITNIVQAQRDPDEEGDYMAFEQLMAEANVKRDKKDGKKKKRHSHHKSSKDKEEEKPAS